MSVNYVYYLIGEILVTDLCVQQLRSQMDAWPTLYVSCMVRYQSYVPITR